MSNSYGTFFSDDFQKWVKEQFCYMDEDPKYGERLFFENSGGSLRLQRAVDEKAKWEEFPDCPERVREIGRAHV